MITYDIRQIFPRFLLEDKNGYALAKAIDAALNYLNNAIDAGMKNLNDVDNMPEWRLDEMAWEMNAFWYDYQSQAAEKREQIRQAMEIYSHIGTPNAVLRAVEALFGSGKLEEAWEYDGQPYHFRLLTTEPMDTEAQQKLNRLVSQLKNLRSHYDGFVYYGENGEAEMHALAKAVGFAGYVSAIAHQYQGVE